MVRIARLRRRVPLLPPLTDGRRDLAQRVFTDYWWVLRRARDRLSSGRWTTTNAAIPDSCCPCSCCASISANFSFFSCFVAVDQTRCFRYYPLEHDFKAIVGFGFEFVRRSLSSSRDVNAQGLHRWSRASIPRFADSQSLEPKDWKYNLLLVYLVGTQLTVMQPKIIQKIRSISNTNSNSNIIKQGQ